METTQEPLTFEKVWAMFQETDRQFKETDRQIKETDRKFQETDRQFKETDKKFQETDRQFKETDKKFQETDRLFKELKEDSKKADKRMKELNNLFEGQWGKLIESLIRDDLVALLNNRNIDVSETYTRLKKLYNGKQYEIDIIAANGKDVVAVEVKTTMKIKDVQHYLNKLRIFKEVFPKYKDLTIYGGMAFIHESEQSASYAESQGLFVIKGTGKSSSITNSEDFVPFKF